MMGSYQRFEKSEEQIIAQQQDASERTLRNLVEAIGSVGGSNTGSDSGTSQSTTYIVRFLLGKDMETQKQIQFADVTVKVNDERSLKDLYDSQIVKDRVRKCFDLLIAQAVTQGQKELVLNYKNHANGSVYQQFPVKHLANNKAADLIGSIPKDGDRPVDGAAYPLILKFGIVDTITTLEEGAFL